ncbi:hypothetical protein [Lutimonas halocynthiae]
MVIGILIALQINTWNEERKKACTDLFGKFKTKNLSVCL